LNISENIQYSGPSGRLFATAVDYLRPPAMASHLAVFAGPNLRAMPCLDVLTIGVITARTTTTFRRYVARLSVARFATTPATSKVAEE
jgi:hypothetical protein